MPTRTTNNSNHGNDFNIESLTETTNSHGEILKRVDTSENFGKTFKDAASQSKDIDEAIKGAFLDLLKSDAEINQELKTIIKNTDRHAFYSNLGKILFALGGALISGFGAWVFSLFN